MELDVASGEFRELALSGTSDVRPQYSPDGEAIMFMSAEFGDTRDVALYDRATRAAARVAIPGTDDFDENRAVWSPDGSSIYFDATYDGEAADIYCYTFATGALETVVGGPGNQRYASVAPDGACMVYRDDHGPDIELFVLVFATGESTQITENDSVDQAATWSPDGRYITYFSQESGDPEIYVSRPDGSMRSRLTHSPDWDFMPVFSPDGSTIAFDSRRTGRRGLYLMDADGANVRHLTNTARSPLIDAIEAQGAAAALAEYESALGADAYVEPPFTQAEAGVLIDQLLRRDALADAIRITDAWLRAYPWSAARDDWVDTALGAVEPNLSYRAARDQSSWNLTAHGLALFKLGRNDEARTAFAAALASTAANPIASEGMRRLDASAND